MLSQEQLAAILRATGKLPPSSPSTPSPQLPQLLVLPRPAAPLGVPLARPSQWSSLVDNQGKPIKGPSLKRGRPKSDQLTQRDLQKVSQTRVPPTRMAGLSQAKGVTKEVEIHFKERLDWLVAQLHLHYKPDWDSRPGTMLLESRVFDVKFDGLCTLTACRWPVWLLDVEAQRTGYAPEEVMLEYTYASFQHQDVTGMATAHWHGRHVMRRVCRPGDRCGECTSSRQDA